MMALSIRQPWAWMIVHGWKDIENRDWLTRFRGRFLVHASKGMTRDEYYDACALARSIRGNLDGLPPFEEIERGGFIGSVELIDCVEIGTRAPSLPDRNPWFFGRYGFVLRLPRLCAFYPYRGALNFFPALCQPQEYPA
jgi:hypothetical protein